ncbi:MAG: helix-turn-helix domain-containing protein [Candidatus Ornithospirochaeta sp.]
MHMDEISFVSSVLSRLSIRVEMMENNEDFLPCGEKGKEVIVVRVHGGDEMELVFRHKGNACRIGPFLCVWKADSSLPYADWDGTVYPLLSTLFDSIYGKEKWTIRHCGGEIKGYPSSVNFSDAERIALRYRTEEMMLEAVKRGDLSFVKHYTDLEGFMEGMVEKRNPNEVRNIQNYSIILNTLLRKSAGEAGVPPILLDTLSSEFGRKIEKLSTTYGVRKLFREMLIAYSSLIRKEARREYPEKIRRVIFEIDTRYSDELSLSSLSRIVSLSPSHLSRLFRKTVGEGISSYITKTRISHAVRLLENPDYRIGEISAATGFQDPSYFSRVFCSVMGMRPEKWRKAFLLREI